MADVPRRRRHPPARPRARVRRLPRAAVRAVHDHALPRGPRRSCATRSPGCPASTPTRSSPPRSDPETEALFEHDRDEARTAAGSPDRVPGQARQHRRPRALHGAEPQASPTAGRDARGRRLPVLRGLRRAVANLDTSLARRAPAEDAAEVLQAFPDGLTTAEVAQIMAEDKYPADLDAGRGRPDHRDRATASASACRSGTTRCGCPSAPRRRSPRRRRTQRRGRRASAARVTLSYGLVVDSVKVSVLAYVTRTQRVVGLDRLLEADRHRVVGRRGRPRSAATSGAEPPTGA